MVERTFVAIKPDGVERGLIGEILSRLERSGLKIIAMKMVWLDKEFAAKHYAAHTKKPFYSGLVDFITSGPVIAMVVEGVHAIAGVRKMIGPTAPQSAAPGTIRGDYSHLTQEYADRKRKAIKNLIHASETKKDAEQEIRLWFKPEEIHTYSTVHEKHVF